MSATEYIFVGIFIAVALFTVVEAIRIPLIVKRWYREHNFTDHGKQQLEDVSDSVLLKDTYTDHLNTGTVQGVEVTQCTAWSIHRRQFTLSKAKRNRNKTAWSVTLVNVTESSTDSFQKFLALPTIVPEAVGYIGDGRSIDFPGDDQLVSRYHVTTDAPEQIRGLLSGEVREFLLKPEIMFVEQTSTMLVLKRKWSPEKPTERMQQEIKIALKLCNQLAATTVLTV